MALTPIWLSSDDIQIQIYGAADHDKTTEYTLKDETLGQVKWITAFVYL